MLDQLLQGLTEENKTELRELGITKARRSDWKTGRRLPTSAQLLTLAKVLKIDPAPLLLWHAEQEASATQRQFFRAIANGSTVRAAVALAVSLSATTSQAFALYPSGFQAHSLQLNTLHIVNKLRSLLRRGRSGRSSHQGRAAPFFFVLARTKSGPC